MNALRDALDFELKINRPTDGGLWGSEVEPGNFTGLSGDITQNKTDIGFADIFIKLENLKHMDYTYPYFTEWVCYLVIYFLCNKIRDSSAHSFCSLSKRSRCQAKSQTGQLFLSLYNQMFGLQQARLLKWHILLLPLLHDNHPNHPI